jgi:hypothetical protein
MKPRSHLRPRLEQLEDRFCPSLTVQLLPGNLYVSGTPTGNVVITEVNANVFQVQDGTSNLGSYQDGGNLYLLLTNHQGKSVNINLNGHTLGGNLFINEGTGDTNSFAAFGTGIYGGRVGGSVTVVGGSGEEELVPGFQVIPAAPFIVPFGLTVGGDFNYNARANTGAFKLNILDTGGLFPPATAPVVNIGGNLNTTAVDAIALGPNTTIEKNLNDSPAGEQAMELFIFGHVNQNVSFSAGFSPPGAGFPTTLFLDSAGSIGGNLSANLGSGDNSVTLNPGSVVGGSANLSEQGNGTLEFDGAVNGSFTLNLGDGNSTVAFTGTATVGGNMSVTGGSGNNDLATTPFAGSVAGNLTFNFGNGADSVTIANAPGGTLAWTSGNGADSLTLAPTTAGQNWNVNVRFGNSDDTFTLTGAGGFITGSADGGGRILGNVIIQDPTWTIGSPWTLSNFP